MKEIMKLYNIIKDREYEEYLNDKGFYDSSSSEEENNHFRTEDIFTEEEMTDIEINRQYNNYSRNSSKNIYINKKHDINHEILKNRNTNISIYNKNYLQELFGKSGERTYTKFLNIMKNRQK